MAFNQILTEYENNILVSVIIRQSLMWTKI